MDGQQERWGSDLGLEPGKKSLAMWLPTIFIATMLFVREESFVSEEQIESGVEFPSAVDKAYAMPKQAKHFPACFKTPI